MLQIVWKQKHQREHGTCDKKILTPPSIRICPLFDELKKGDFFYPPPSHMDQCLLPSNFFFECFPYFIYVFGRIEYRLSTLSYLYDIVGNNM